MEDIDYTIGDDIVCVNSKNTNLVQYKVYSALEFEKAPCCGNSLVYVGNMYSEEVTGMRCSRCGQITRDPRLGLFYLANRFKKLDDLIETDELIEALQHEYEEV